MVSALRVPANTIINLLAGTLAGIIREEVGMKLLKSLQKEN